MISKTIAKCGRRLDQFTSGESAEFARSRFIVKCTVEKSVNKLQCRSIVELGPAVFPTVDYLEMDGALCGFVATMQLV